MSKKVCHPVCDVLACITGCCRCLDAIGLIPKLGPFFFFSPFLLPPVLAASHAHAAVSPARAWPAVRRVGGYGGLVANGCSPEHSTYIHTYSTHTYLHTLHRTRLLHTIHLSDRDYVVPSWVEPVFPQSNIPSASPPSTLLPHPQLCGHTLP